MKQDGLTLRQRQFCFEYMIDFNGTQAAIRAGYSPKSAKSTATEILSYPHVKAFISDLQKARHATAIMTREEVLANITTIARKEDAKDADKLKADELMGRHYALFTDKQVVDVGEETLDRVEGMTLAQRKERLDQLLANFHEGSE